MAADKDTSVVEQQSTNDDYEFLLRARIRNHPSSEVDEFLKQLQKQLTETFGEDVYGINFATRHYVVREIDPFDDFWEVQHAFHGVMFPRFPNSLFRLLW